MDSNGGSFDRIRGEDSWVGQKVLKGFWIGRGKNKRHTFCSGTVTLVDDDADFPGHRLFEVQYDDGDVECLGPDDIHEILVSTIGWYVTRDCCFMLSLLMLMFSYRDQIVCVFCLLDRNGG